jgi:hypothetical protein
VLNDIEIAQKMQEDTKAKTRAAAAAAAAAAAVVLPRNPHDEKYDSLKCDLDVVDRKSKEYTVIEQYLAATKNQGYGKAIIQDVFSVSRHG